MVLWFFASRFHGSMVLGSMVLWFFSSMVLWFFRSMVLWFYGSTILWFYGSMVFGSMVL